MPLSLRVPERRKGISRETGENNQDRMYQGKAINRNRLQPRPDEEGMNDAAIGALSELEIMRRGCLASVIVTVKDS